MKSFLAVSFALSIAATLSSMAHAGNDNILTDKAGMTLYTFDKDSKNTSVCYDGCASKWPPYTAKADAKAKKKNWGIITRKDGTQQWTYNKKPLYTWVGDAKSGDTNGDGLGGVWHVAKTNKKANKESAKNSHNPYGGGKY